MNTHTRIENRQTRETKLKERQQQRFQIGQELK